MNKRGVGGGKGKRKEGLVIGSMHTSQHRFRVRPRAEDGFKRAHARYQCTCALAMAVVVVVVVAGPRRRRSVQFASGGRDRRGGWRDRGGDGGGNL